MKINTAKYQLLIEFGKTIQTKDIIVLGNDMVENVNVVKMPGMYVDSNHHC